VCVCVCVCVFVCVCVRARRECVSLVQECLANHPLTGGPVLGQNAFGKTRGFVIAFNRSYIVFCYVVLLP